MRKVVAQENHISVRNNVACRIRLKKTLSDRLRVVATRILLQCPLFDLMLQSMTSQILVRHRPSDINQKYLILTTTMAHRLQTRRTLQT